MKHGMALRILKALLLFCTGISIVIVGIMTIWFINEIATMSSVLQMVYTIPIFIVTLAWCGYFALKALSVMLDKPVANLMNEGTKSSNDQKPRVGDRLEVTK